MRLPKEMWVIWDPLDGVHVFRSRKEAIYTWEKWRGEAKHRSYDSWWDMLPPARYYFDFQETVKSNGEIVS